ncbi:hypothetical protein GUITHDRAFT_71756, partial [Guillardia theta CCMP2712]
VELEDLKEVDKEVHSNLKWIVNNPVKDLNLTFEHCMESNGKVHEIPLKPGGQAMYVNETNKNEFVSLVVSCRTTRAVRQQLRAMREGFNSCIPSNVYEAITVEDLSTIISGTCEVDVDDWRKHTELVGWKASDNVVKWFFEMLEQASNEFRCCVLKFSCALSRPPAGGFRRMPNKFRICKTELPLPRLPTAHTCFAEIVLPEYQTRDDLIQAFQRVVVEGMDNFGIS